jgi:hypothetical protein
MHKPTYQTQSAYAPSVPPSGSGKNEAIAQLIVANGSITIGAKFGGILLGGYGTA